MYNAQPTPSVYFLIYTTRYLMRLMRPATTAVRCAKLSLIKHLAYLSAAAPLMQFEDNPGLRRKLPQPYANAGAARMPLIS